MNKRRIKPYAIAVLLVVLYAANVFWLGDIIGAKLGLLGSVISEILLVVTAVGIFWIFHGKMKVIFPFKKPEPVKIAGTIVLWLGAYGAAMVVTMIMSYFFPQEMMGASEGIQEIIMNVPAILSLLVISLSPAICEEMAFRGALLSCFRSLKNRWVAIMIVSVIFGAFHGSIWRMIPTMLLGIAMGYLLFETENMIYNMLFHLVNNAFPILLLAIMNGIMGLAGEDFSGMMESSSQMAEVPFASVGVYIMYGGAVPFLLYLGKYLIHKGQPGYDRGVFPKEKQKTLIVLISVGIGMMLLGLIMMVVSMMSMQISYGR